MTLLMYYLENATKNFFWEFHKYQVQNGLFRGKNAYQLTKKVLSYFQTFTFIIYWVKYNTLLINNYWTKWKHLLNHIAWFFLFLSYFFLTTKLAFIFILQLLYDFALLLQLYRFCLTVYRINDCFNFFLIDFKLNKYIIGSSKEPIIKDMFINRSNNSDLLSMIL